MGKTILSQQWLGATLTGLFLLGSLEVVFAGHSAATIDDTGSIFDEDRGSSPDLPMSSTPPPPPAPIRPVPKTQKPDAPLKPAETKPPAPSRSARPVHLPVPDEKARAASLKLIREVYRDDYGKPAPADQRTLAQRLFDQSRETPDDLAARYVLLSEASNRAATAGDAALAMKAIRGLARTFQTDAPSAALVALTTASKANVAADQLNATARAALDFSREAALADDLATAGLAAEIAQAAARRGKDVKLLKVLKQQADRVAELRRGADAVKDQSLRLKVDPNDADACLAVGKYRCFVRGDWPAGMRLLARSSDPVLKPLAVRDVTLRRAASDADESVAADQAASMADAWWAASEAPEADASLKTALQTRACEWYARAASSLAGVRRAQLEKKINAVRFARLKSGLVGHYYNNHSYSHEALERIDTQINFNWKDGSPAAGVNADNFAVWWRGYIKAPTPGKYKIVTDQDDGCRVFLDGKLVIDQWHDYRDGVYTADVEFSTEPQSLYIEYVEVHGPARMGLGWYVPGSNKPAPVPASFLFHEPDGPLRISMPRPRDVEHLNGHCYKVFDQTVAWYAARQWCEEMGGHLTMIETREEQEFLNTLVAGRQCWIGLNDEEEEGIWRWTDGRLARYFEWSPGDPNEGEAANFAITYNDGWADTRDGQHAFVCEWDD